jgi:molybdopterin synthase catalytic subunit
MADEILLNSVEIYQGDLKPVSIFENWYNEYKSSNYGAFITFTGIIRDEDGIDGLSFDVYEPMLNKWFEDEQKKVQKDNAIIVMAHSQGDVKLFESSFVCAVLSPKRRAALELIDSFVENFKANAPIWKYDLRDGKREFAKDRSQLLDGAGILS